MNIVVGGLIEKNGKFLLVQEAKKKCYKKWNLPAGHLDEGEVIFDGAKREIFEETGCEVELTGIVQISNKISANNSLVIFVFSTNMLKENIKFDKNEILDVKWFSYEELINMKDELRSSYILNAIERYKNNKIIDLSNISIEKE